MNFVYKMTKSFMLGHLIMEKTNETNETIIYRKSTNK